MTILVDDGTRSLALTRGMLDAGLEVCSRSLIDVAPAVIGCMLNAEGSNSEVVGAESIECGVAKADDSSCIIVDGTRVPGDANGGL